MSNECQSNVKWTLPPYTPRIYLFHSSCWRTNPYNHSGKDLNRTGKQRVKEKEEILSGGTHWNAITASVTLERTDGALDPPHRERLFYKAIITRDSSVSQSEIELPSLLLGQNWGFQQDVGCPDRTHTGPRTRVPNGLQSCVQQQVNGQERPSRATSSDRGPS